MRFAARFWLVLGVLLAVPAFAQKVVILEIDGDTKHKLRAQIEAAVRQAGQVEVLSLQSYKDAAAKKKLKGAAAFTAAGVARTSKALRFDAAVSGEIDGATYKVLIWDRTGQQLWTKDLKISRGLLSDDYATKLSKAIAKAAEQGAMVADTGGGAEQGGDSGDTSGEGLDLTGNSGPTSGVGNSNPNRPPEDPNRDTDLDNQGPKTAAIPAPALFKGSLFGTTTWRSQCLRPGVSTCHEYDLSMNQPKGIVIDFTASVPYLGIGLSVELFPLARFNSESFHRFINGLGLVGNFAFGSSLTKIVEATPQGTGAEKSVTSTDLQWNASLVYRVHFFMGMKGDGDKLQPAGYVGLRGGLQSRSFNIDPNAGTSLPSSQRALFPAVGVDVSLPIVRFFRIEGAFNLYLNPKPSAEQIVGYGNLNDPTGGAASSGYGFEAGASGDIYGPLGWTVKLRYMSFVDHFYGQGQKWTICNDQQCGGVGEEVFTQIIWGLTGSF